MPNKGNLKHMIAAADIFDSLTQEKKAKVERKRQKQMEEEKENKSAHTNSKAGKAASKINVPQVGYNQRANRGQCRGTYNEGVNKIPGLYNTEGRIEVITAKLPVKYQHKEPTTGYQIYNLTANARTQAMHEQFEVMEEILR